MKDNAHRIVAEAILINKVFKARKMGVRVLPNDARQPSHYLTPSTVVYDLEVPMSLDGAKLISLQDDLLSYVGKFRQMNGVATLDYSGMAVTPTLRIDRYSHTLEVSRPNPDVLPWSKAVWTPRPMTAFCGMRFGHSDPEPVYWDLSKPDQAHGLIAGVTGSGKTNTLLDVLYSLMLGNSPVDLQITLCDPKYSEGMQMLDNLPHMQAVVRSLDDVVTTIQKFHTEMLDRERGVIDRNVRHILAIEECASLTEHENRNVQKQVIGRLADIARRSRQNNMNLIICTQKPTAEVLGDQLKSNLSMRLVGAVNSKDDALTALNVKQSGAEMLPGYGAFIYRLNRSMFRFQAPLVNNPGRLCGSIVERWCGGVWTVQGGAELVQPVVHIPVRPGAGAENTDRTRVQRPEPIAPVQVVQPFPLVDKRPLTTDEAAEVRKMAATMSKNSLCVHVYGAKSSRYMEWINAALVDSQPAKKAPAFGRMLASLVREVKPL